MPADPEFSRPVDPETVDGDLRGAADAGELARLTARYRVPAVRALRYAAALTPWDKGGWRLEGAVEAELTQTCVVTLDPVDTTLREPFRRYYAQPGRLDIAVETLSEDDADLLEPLGAAIDPADVAAEAAALAIDPYPRVPGAAFDGVLAGPPGAVPLTDEAARPFAALAALRGGADGGGGGDPGDDA